MHKQQWEILVVQAVCKPVSLVKLKSVNVNPKV